MTKRADLSAYRYAFRAMGGPNELTLHVGDRKHADAAARAAIADVLRIEAKFSRYRDDSVITAINRAAGGDAIAIDAETAALLRFGDRCHRLSEARFDLTSGVLRRAWNFSRDAPCVPTRDEIEEARACVGWERVEWSDDCVRLPSGMELDFGGIGKEYAADRAATLLIEHGVEHGFVNLGGDVRAIGAQPDGAPWRVGLQHPRRVDAVVGTVEICDAAVATSGDYARYFEFEGRRYCHLLDARSGRPVDHWQSASVIAPLAILAGSYATIAMLLGAGAESFLDAQAADYLLVAKDGSIRHSARAVVPASPQAATAQAHTCTDAGRA